MALAVRIYNQLFPLFCFAPHRKSYLDVSKKISLTSLQKLLPGDVITAWKEPRKFAKQRRLETETKLRLLVAKLVVVSVSGGMGGGGASIRRGLPGLVMISGLPELLMSFMMIVSSVLFLLVVVVVIVSFPFEQWYTVGESSVSVL